MKFQKLLNHAGIQPRAVRGDRVAEIDAVTIDSRKVRPGMCFVAIRGWTDDGHKYVEDALRKGASAVVVQDDSAAAPDATCAVVDDTRQAIGRLAQALHDWPARKLTAVGITGTNGKTTVACLLKAILAHAGHSPAMLGTIRYETGSRTIDAVTTTPDPVSLAEMTAEMVRSGATHLVMEVSSHALDQDRTAGIDFRAGVFTNLSGDHLDYHKTMARYRQAKGKLFQQLGVDADAVINTDDAAGEKFAAATPARVTGYGLRGTADIHARLRSIDADGTRFELVTPDSAVEVHTSLIGKHNVYNCLAAAGAALVLGIEPKTIAAAIATVHSVPGRLQRVPCDGGYGVFVDYAHTDDALANVLRGLRPVTQGRLIAVFGCGGDRDKTKRPRMAAVAEDLADVLFVTSDNPRSEDPEAIIADILEGLSRQAREQAVVDADRRSAIRRAVQTAEQGDVILIAGKGHETYQVIGDQRNHFDDAEEARAAIRAREAGR